MGSIYTYCTQVHRVPAIMLDENYRSNATIVEFARSAGYEAALASYSPDLQLDLLAPLPATQPPDWPACLYWTPDWAALFDPDASAACFVYAEGRSSQSNPFEADAVAALLWLLSSRLGDQLRNERDPRQGGAVKTPAARGGRTRLRHSGAGAWVS